MEFQFPANPQVGDTVVNSSTGTSYVWSTKGKWQVAFSSVNSIPVFEGPVAPLDTEEYLLWLDTTSGELKYFYCDDQMNCSWVSTATGGSSNEHLAAQVSQLSNVILELQTKVNILENTSFIIME